MDIENHLWHDPVDCEDCRGMQEAAERSTEMQTALHRLPKPPDDIGDGPDERVGHVLERLREDRQNAIDAAYARGVDMGEERGDREANERRHTAERKMQEQLTWTEREHAELEHELARLPEAEGEDDAGAEARVSFVLGELACLTLERDEALSLLLIGAGTAPRPGLHLVIPKIRTAERRKVAAWLAARAEEYPKDRWPDVDLSEHPPSAERDLAERNAMHMARDLAVAWSRRLLEEEL